MRSATLFPISAPVAVSMLAMLVLTGTAHAQSSQSRSCDTVLVQQNKSWMREYGREYLALLRLVDNNNFEQANKDGDLIIEGKGSANYSEFNQRRQSLYDKLNYTRDAESARSVVTSITPVAAINAWSACMRDITKGLFAWVTDETTNAATITVEWSPMPGLSYISNVVIDVNGEKRTINKLQGKESFTVSRQVSTQDIRGTVNGTVNDGNYSATFLIPGKKKSKVTIVQEAGRIPDAYVDGVGKRVSYVTANAHGGHITSNTGCTSLPAGHFVRVGNGHPELVAGYAGDYQGTHLQAFLTTQPGDRSDVCFHVQCGNKSGGFTACTARLKGDMMKRVQQEVEM